MIDRLKNEDETIFLLSKVESLIGVFIKNCNAYHILIKCITKFKENEVLISAVYDSIAADVIDFSNHKAGCSAIQKCIDAASPSFQTRLIDIISKNTEKLIFDKYGYYVLCHALSKRAKKTVIEVGSIIRLNLKIADVCKHRQSRIVLEKCLEYSDAELRSSIIKLLKDKDVFDEIVLTESGLKGK